MHTQATVGTALPFVVLDAGADKSRRGADIPLRPDLASDLRQWLQLKLVEIQAPELPPDLPIFNVPSGLLRILNRDLKLAGIPKKDDRGRSVDIHALRHSFCTHLSKAGVAPRVAQEAMRHSSIDLTMNHYTDPRLLDVHDALDRLPKLPLGAEQELDVAEARATGSGGAVREFAPGFAPKSDKSSTSMSFPVTLAASSRSPEKAENPAKHSVSQGFLKSGRQDGY